MDHSLVERKGVTPVNDGRLSRADGDLGAVVVRVLVERDVGQEDVLSVADHPG